MYFTLETFFMSDAAILYNSPMHANRTEPSAGRPDPQAIGALRAWLAAADLAVLACSWPRLDSLRKLLLFKLLAAPRALELYGRLPFREKYFLFCGFPISVIAPILEDAPPALRRAFVQLPAKFGDLMRQDLLRDAGKRSA